MDTLFNMRAFKCVAEAGSFTGGALVMDTTTANTSRAVSNLESHLRTRLLNRTTRKLSLTEAGKRYLVRCQDILRSIDEAEAEAGDAQAHPSGKLKVHAMTGIGQHFIIEATARYAEIYPGVSFNLTMANRIPDLLDEGYDISVVMANDLPDSGFVSQRLGSTYSIVCASPSYVKKYGLANKPADLKSHRCLRLFSPVIELERWLFDGPEGQEMIQISEAPFEVNTADAMNVAITNGLGVGVLPAYVALEGLRNGSLVRMLPDYRLQPLNMFAIYPSRHFLDAKIKTWVEFLQQHLPPKLQALDDFIQSKALSR